MTHAVKIVDLDGTLWNLDSSPWIILKEDPSKPVLRISKNDRILIENDTVNSDLVIEHCGRRIHISEEMLKKIQSKIGRKVTPEKLGFSYAEWIMPEELAKQADNMFYYEGVIKDLAKKPGDTVILTSRFNQGKHTALLMNLERKLAEYKVQVKDFHFVGNSNAYPDKEANAAKKSYVVLQYLIGLQIDRLKKRFLQQKTDSYVLVDFYDDEPINLSNVENLQSYLNTCFYNSDQDVKRMVLERLNLTKLVVHVNRATGNQLKPYEKKVIELTFPDKKVLF
jgi:hypothetical protein